MLSILSERPDDRVGASSKTYRGGEKKKSAHEIGRFEPTARRAENGRLGQKELLDEEQSRLRKAPSA
jgi:hypothetical protein